jgi:hypothetical protein
VETALYEIVVPMTKTNLNRYQTIAVATWNNAIFVKLPEIHTHAKVKEKTGYGKQYHFLVIVRLSILYMENVL